MKRSAVQWPEGNLVFKSSPIGVDERSANAEVDAIHRAIRMSAESA